MKFKLLSILSSEGVKFNFLSILSSITGGIIGFLFGGWGILLSLLFFSSIVDYVSGMVASWFEGGLKSKTGYIGIARKVLMFCIIAIAHMLDVYFAKTGDMIFNTVGAFYLANEILSITENGGRIGLPIPKPLINAIAVLKQRGEATNEDSKEVNGQGVNE